MNHLNGIHQMDVEPLLVDLGAAIEMIGLVEMMSFDAVVVAAVAAAGAEIDVDAVGLGVADDHHYLKVRPNDLICFVLHFRLEIPRKWLCFPVHNYSTPFVPCLILHGMHTCITQFHDLNIDGNAAMDRAEYKGCARWIRQSERK